MRTVKIKVKVRQKSRVAQTKEELRWCWNEIRYHAIMHHCKDWYKWAARQSNGKGLFPKFSLEDIEEVPLRFGKRGAWMGAACKIAVGGKVWRTDESITIQYKEDGETKTKFGAKLVDGDRPYIPITLKGYKPPVPGVFNGVGSLNVGVMQELRENAGLEPLTIYSKYFYGLLDDFQTAWKAYLDTKLPDRHMPRFKDGKQRTVTSIYNNQTSDLANLIRDDKFHLKDGNRQTIICVPRDRKWKKRIGNLTPRSYRLVERPSGTYLCITVATAAECNIPTARVKMRQIAIALKKEHPNATKDELKEIRDNHEGYIAAGHLLESLQSQAAQENIQGAKYNQARTAKIEYKLGVNHIAKTSEIEFGNNVSRYRIDEHISRLQQKLDIMRNSNDKRLGKSYRYGKRKATKNEQKLMDKISRLHERAKNSTTAYNQKKSTQFVRMAGRLIMRSYDVKSMLRSPEPILHESGNFYLPNGGTRKTVLNRLLKNASLGQLQSLIETKAKATGVWVEPPEQKKPKKGKSKTTSIKAAKGKSKKQKVA